MEKTLTEAQHAWALENNLAVSPDVQLPEKEEEEVENDSEQEEEEDAEEEEGDEEEGDEAVQATPQTVVQKVFAIPAQAPAAQAPVVSTTPVVALPPSSNAQTELGNIINQLNTFMLTRMQPQVAPTHELDTLKKEVETLKALVEKQRKQIKALTDS